jgi:hypothetical protein
VAEPAHNYDRTTYGGRTVNYRTKQMLEQAAQLFGRGNGWTITQGSYNRGVGASAGTHDGGGVVDISVSGMTTSQRSAAVQALRKVGFFAWLRTPAQGFAYHIHAVAIGDKQLSSAAKSQVVQGFQDRNGLAGRGPDPDADPYPTWIDKYGKHVSLDRPKAPSTPSSSYVPYPGEAWFKNEPRSPIVTAMGKRLVAVGCSAYEDGPGPQWTDADRASYRKWQLKCGFTGDDANGWPGRSSWDKLKVPK